MSGMEAGSSTTRDHASSLDLLKAALAGLYTPRRLALVVLLQGLLLLGHVSTSWHASSDSALYMGLGRSILEGQGYVFNYEPHAMVPPLFPLLLAGVMKVFGPSYLALNLCQVALALACTLMALRLFRRLYGDDLGFLGTGLFALSFVLWVTASMVISDLLFCLLAMGGMLAATWAAAPSRGRWGAVLVTGALIAACSLVRVNGLVLLPGAVVALWWGWKDRPRIVRALAVAAMIAASVAPLKLWQGYVGSIRAGQGATYLQTSHLSKPFGEMIGGVCRNLFLELPTEMSNMLVGFSDVPAVLNLLLPAAAIVGCAVCLRDRRPIVPLTLLGMMGLLGVVSGVRMRFLLFLAPGLYVLALVGITAAVRAARRGRGLSAAPLRKALLISLGVVVAIHVGHSGARLYKFRRGSVPGGHRLGERQGWFTACEYMIRHDPGASAGRPMGTAVLTRRPALVHYLTRAKTLPTKGYVPISPERMLRYVHEYRPQYLLAEAGDERTERALAAIRRAGATAEKVPGLQLTGRITLWRITYALSESTTSEAAS